MAAMAVGTAVGLILITPPRPLWPAVTALQMLGAEDSANPLLRRAWTVYSVYGGRADAFAPARAILPPEANPLGLVTFDDPETSLWRPFGSRRIIHVTRADTADTLRTKKIRYVLVSDTALAIHHQSTIAALADRLDGVVVETRSLTLRAGTGARDWYLVRIGEQTNP
jgi:hypothetical protein